MQLKESGEMYLETIYVLSKKSNYIRSIDVCEEMGYSKPSVSRAVGLLKEGGYLKVGDDGSLILTDLDSVIVQPFTAYDFQGDFSMRQRFRR